MSGYTIFGIILVVVSLWMAFEVWRAPLMEETDDGRLITKRPAKKFSDLFKKMWVFISFLYILLKYLLVAILIG